MAKFCKTRLVEEKGNRYFLADYRQNSFLFLDH